MPSCSIQTRNGLGGSFLPLGNLRDRRPAAARSPLDGSPGLPHGEHAPDPVIPLRILRPALVAPLGLRLGLTLCLPPTPIIVILTSDRREHVEQHAVDGFEHARGEFVGGVGRHHPRRRQIQRDDPHATAESKTFSWKH